MSKHTELPYHKLQWRSAYINDHKHFHIQIVNKDTGVAVCILPKEDESRATRKLVKANAEFIVRSCNCHDELLEALKMAVGALRENDIDESMAGEFEILTDAITKAEGGK